MTSPGGGALAVAEDGVRLVGFFEAGDFFRSELQVHGGQGILKLVGLAGADDRGGDAGFAEDPGQGYLRVLDAARLRDLRNTVDEGEVRRPIVEVVRVGVGAGAGGL